MTSDPLAVDVKGGLIVARTEVQQHSAVFLQPLRRHLDLTTVPYTFAEVTVADPGKLALHAERNPDPVGKRGRLLQLSFSAAYGTVTLKLPFPIQIFPRFPYKLRAGILGT